MPEMLLPRKCSALSAPKEGAFLTHLNLGLWCKPTFLTRRGEVYGGAFVREDLELKLFLSSGDFLCEL